MDGEYADGPIGSKTFDKSKMLVFRDHKEKKRKTVANCEVVDVHVAAGIDFSVKFLWDANEGESHYYSFCKVTADDIKVQAFYNKIRQQDYQMLHQLCGSLFRKYSAKLQYVKTNPLTLYMVHQNMRMFEAMLSDPRLSELISVYVGPIIRLTWSDSTSPMIVEHQLVFEQVTEKDSRLKELENHLQNLINTSEARLEEQTAFNSRILSMIERLQLCISKMNTTTNMETNEAGNFDGLSTETAHQDHGVFETRGPINETIEGNSHLTSKSNSSRDTVGDGQQPNTSNYYICIGQQHIHSYMSYCSEAENDDEDSQDYNQNMITEGTPDVTSRGYSSRDIIGDGQPRDVGQQHFHLNISSTSEVEDDYEVEVKGEDENNTQDVPCKYEPHETTVDISQSTHCHVQGTKVKLVTKGSRSQDKGRKVDMYAELMGN